jgi:outer membrane murein-binding lipoprotein Lpp
MRWKLGVLAVGSALLAGCAKKGPPATQPAAQPQVVTSRLELEQKIQQLHQQAAAFADTADQLAGRSDQGHQMLVEQSLTELTQLLPLLAGPGMDGGLNQHIQVIESSRNKLRNADEEQAAGPTINTALRSASGSLERIMADGFADQPQLAEVLNQLKGKIGELDTTRGAIHQLVVAQCMELMSQAVSGMSQATIERWQNQMRLAQPAGDSAGE